MEPTLTEVIKASPVIVHPGRYAYLKSQDKQLKDHFLICQDADEITIVTEEKNLNKTQYEKAVKWFKLLEFRVSLPFQAPGFLAKIAQTIANQKMNILLVSTFSKDYALIREEDFSVAVKALSEIGFSIQ